MKIYCFIKDDKMGIYDNPNWKLATHKLKLMSLEEAVGRTEVLNFIKYVVSNYAGVKTKELEGHPDTFMYEVEF